jgi:hypothetical protein
VCQHESRAEIEAKFLAWESPQKIAEEYGLADRATILVAPSPTGGTPARPAPIARQTRRVGKSAVISVRDAPL